MKSYFFNAEPTNDLLSHPTGYDREYDADDHAAFFAPLFSEAGVFAGLDAGACKVSVQEGRTLRVCAGACYVKGRMCRFDGTETVEAAPPCKIVARMNKSADVRGFQLLAVEKPVRDEDIYDLELARVTEADGALALADTRTFLSFAGQPPYYPPDSDHLPYILWLYTMGFPMTGEQRAAVEGNDSLMDIYRGSVGAAYRKFYRRFVDEDWQRAGSTYEIAVPPQDHRLNATLPICLHELHMLVGKTAEDYKAATLAEGQTRFINAVKAANTANTASPGTYPTAADGHIILTWYQIQYYILSGSLVSAAVAESQAATKGYDWKDTPTQIPAGPVNTLEALLAAAYTPMLGGSAAGFNALFTLDTAWGLNLRRKADTQQAGARHEFDLFGRMVGNTWACIETEVALDGTDRWLRLHSETPYTGEIIVVG